LSKANIYFSGSHNCKNSMAKKMGTIIMEKFLTSVDSTAVRLIGYEDVLTIPVLKIAHDTKWGAVIPEEIEVLGEKIQDMKCKNFKLSRNAKVINFISPSLNNFVASLTAPNPVVIEEKCIGCKKCDEVCTERPKVISFVVHNNKTIPKWYYKNCIRCFCCQELCPQGAIKIKYKPLSRMLGLK